MDLANERNSLYHIAQQSNISEIPEPKSPPIRIMSLAIALLAHQSLGFELYSALLNGSSTEEISAAYKIPVHQVREKVEAVRLALVHQIRLAVNPAASVFHSRPASAIAAAA
jgi:hypothetical protein